MLKKIYIYYISNIIQKYFFYFTIRNNLNLGLIKIPVISSFYGIIIQMFFDDHNPPHFHAVYNEFKALININDFSIIRGDLPPKAFGLIMEWAKSHQKELLKEWNLAKNKKLLFILHNFDFVILLYK